MTQKDIMNISGKGINLTNIVGTSMTVYITSIGEGTYR